MLEETLRNNPPDVLITELFPFGRRVLREEFQAALAAVKAMVPAPLVFSSIRDILAPPSKAKKAEQTEAWLAEHYDGVLVHSDAGVVPLGGKLAGDAANRAAAPLHRLHRPSHAGREPAEQDGAGEIIVTAGGGPVGRKLFETSIEAARIGGQRWRLLVGGGDAGRRLRQAQRHCERRSVPLPSRCARIIARC